MSSVVVASKELYTTTIQLFGGQYTYKCPYKTGRLSSNCGPRPHSKHNNKHKHKLHASNSYEDILSCFLGNSPHVLSLIFRPPNLKHRRPIAITLFLFVCRVVYWCQTVQNRPIVCIEVEQESWEGARFQLVPFSNPYLHLNPPNGGPIVGNNIGIAAKRRQAEQKVALRSIGLGSRGWAFDWHNSRPPNSSLTPQTPQIVIPQTPSFNFGQTVADDGATLWIDRRSEVIVPANAPKYSVDSH